MTDATPKANKAQESNTVVIPAGIPGNFHSPDNISFLQSLFRNYMLLKNSEVLKPSCQQS